MDALVQAVAERVMGVAQPSEWARELSHEDVGFGDDDRRFDNARFDDARFVKKNFAKQERAGWTARERAMWKLRVQADGAEKASEHMRKFFHRKNGTEAATATNSANTHGPAALVPVPRGGGRSPSRMRTSPQCSRTPRPRGPPGPRRCRRRSGASPSR